MAILLAAAGCSESTLTAKDAGADEPLAPDTGPQVPDTGPRVKEREVTVTLAQIVTREVTRGDDGAPVYGEMQPLEGADVCVVQRREAFAPFEPFEPVDPPICTRSVANRVVPIEGVPANSDLVITVEYEGLQPLALHDRSGDEDAEAPLWAENFSIVLVEPEVADTWWVETTSEPANDHGVVVVGAAVWWTGTGPARAELLRTGETLIGHLDGIGEGPVDVSVEPARGADRFATTTSFAVGHSLPEGSAKVTLENDNSRLSCALPGGLSGLSAEGTDTFELPVLAGHVHYLGLLCTCANFPGDGELLDLATCSFAPGESSDADAGAP